MQAGELDVRQPARAGQFYPGSAQEMGGQIAEFLALADDPSRPRAHRAIMLPHAGWTYCGGTIGRTLGLSAVPDSVIIIGPRHTPYGPPLSITCHKSWRVPGADIPVDTGLVTKLTAAIPALECEAEAHMLEHGSEVLLPFLLARNPDVKVVPIVMGDFKYSHTTKFAKAIAKVIDDLPDAEKPLLVISSDMNHFAPEEENRRLDKLALDAITNADPGELYCVCKEHHISMCGMLPAVTVMQAVAASGKMTPKLVHYTTSAEASGDTSRVVGYAGVLIR